MPDTLVLHCYSCI